MAGFSDIPRAEKRRIASELHDNLVARAASSPPDPPLLDPMIAQLASCRDALADQVDGKTTAETSRTALLDELVTGLGDFAWEVGPGNTEENAFALSPAGNRELLAVTKAIVDVAPNVPGWEFHSAKPAKRWEPRFELQDANGEPFEVDATDWRCVLLEYADGAHEVLVEAANLGSLSEDYKRWAAEIALDSLLGERRRLEVIDEVTVIAELSARERVSAFPVADIRDRIG